MTTPNQLEIAAELIGEAIYALEGSGEIIYVLELLEEAMEVLDEA